MNPFKYCADCGVLKPKPWLGPRCWACSQTHKRKLAVDCDHVCCDEQTNPFHDHFLMAEQCPRCQAIRDDAQWDKGRLIREILNEAKEPQ